MKKSSMDKKAPFNSSKKFEYSITYSAWDEESLEMGETDDKGYEVEPEVENISEILYKSFDKYGIYYPVSIGTWESTEPKEDTDFYEKGIRKYYVLHLRNEDGTEISEEDNDFITHLLSNGEYNREYFEEYAFGGLLGDKRWNRSWHFDHDRYNKSESYEIPMSRRKKARGGDVQAERDWLDNRISNLKNLLSVINDEDAPELQSQISRLEKERDALGSYAGGGGVDFRGRDIGKINVGDIVKYANSNTKYEAKVLDIEYDNEFKGLSSVKIEWLDNGKIESAYLEDLMLSKNKYGDGGSVFANMSEKEFLKEYFGVNTFTSNPSEFFDIKSMSSSNDSKIDAFIDDLKKNGYSIKKKSYSDFTSVMGVKKKSSYADGGGVEWNYWKIEKNDETIYERTNVASPNIPNAKKISKEEYDANVNKKFADGGGVEGHKHVLHIDGQNWFLEKIDSTHFYMSNDRNYRGMAHHIGQHKGEPYYEEVREWLKTTYAKGGSIDFLRLEIQELQEELDFVKQEDDVKWSSRQTKKEYINHITNEIMLKKEQLRHFYDKQEYAKGGSVGSDKSVLQKTIVYDNNGDTFDRYTVFTPDGSVYGMSDNPTSPQGFNQYLGDDTEVEKGEHLGRKLKSVPKSIEKAVLNRMEEDYSNGGSVADVSSVRELYEDEVASEYPYARDMVAYFIFGDREDNKIADAINGRYSNETADESALSEIMLQYEYSWRDNMQDIEEQTMDELGDLTDYYKHGGGVKEKDDNYRYIVSMIENNEKSLKKNMSTEKAEETQREIQRLKDKLKHEYGQTYAKGGDLGRYEDWEMIVVSKELNKDGGRHFKDRFLVSARNIDEAKEIATKLWNETFNEDSDLTIVKVMSESLYRLKYMDKYADGGEIDKSLPKDLKKRLETLNKYLKKYNGRELTEQEAIMWNVYNNSQSGFDAGNKAFYLSDANNFHSATQREYEIIGDALIDISRKITGVEYDNIDFRNNTKEENLRIYKEKYAGKFNNGGEAGEMEDWMNDAIKDLRSYTDNDDLKIENVYDDDYFLASDGSHEYLVFEDFDEAHEYAVDDVKNNLEENPEYFQRDWLMAHLDAGNFFRNVYDEWNMGYATDIMTEDDDKYPNRLIAEMVQWGIMDSDEANGRDAEEIANDRMSDFVNALTDDQINQGNDGFDYYIDNFGEEEAFDMAVKNNLIDIESASEDAVNMDGVAHFISSYDGEEIALDNGSYAYRIN